MKEIIIVFFCSWKFALTFPVAVYGMNMSFAETLFYTNLGGVIGVIFFAFLSQQTLKFWRTKIQPLLALKQKSKPVFSKRRRHFIKIKNSYGFPGIVILNPILISIPISSFLIVKYYGRRNSYLIWLVVGQLVWSIVYTYFFMYLKPLLIN